MRTETVFYTHVRSFEGTFDKCDFCGNDAGKLIQRRKSRRENGCVEALIVHIVCGWFKGNREIFKRQRHVILQLSKACYVNFI